MQDSILGLHHITAIAGSAKINHDFYTKVLGLRLVKKTVNFDDPGTYHFYYGDEQGSPGTILTFFPWEGIAKGKAGAGQATEVGYAIPAGSLGFWNERLQSNNIQVVDSGTRFGERFISFRDPDGMLLTFIEAENDSRTGWATPEVNAQVATKGFHSVSLNLNRKDTTVQVLEIMGYQFVGEEGNRFRYKTNAIGTASIIDITETTDPRGINAAGTIHHIAFRVKDEETEMAWRAKLVQAGFNITQKIDRNYFYSLYFREPNGVLFEIATDNPGFAVDEPLAALGTGLKLPAQYEAHRKQIEEVLPVL